MFTPPARPKAQVNNPQRQRTKSGVLWILNNGQAESVNVEVGITDGQYAQILSGIDENTSIITGITTR